MSTPQLEPGAIRLRDVSRSFRLVHERNLTLKETLLRRGRIKATQLMAVENVDLDVRPGESVGVIGQNGCGKSTLLKLIAGIIPPDTGAVDVSGKVASLLELGAGFHPDFTGRENVYLNAAIYGLSERVVDRRMDRIIDFAEIRDFADLPVRTYSSGMYMRLAFAVASHVDADVLLLDEVLAVGDESFQRKCFGRISEFRRRGGTIVFVSHDPAAVELICDRVVYLESGQVVCDAIPAIALARYHERLSGSIVAPTASREAPESDDASQDEAENPAGATSHGNGRVVITGVRLRNEQGEDVSGFVGGSSFSVEVEYEFKDPSTPSPKFTVRVTQLSGEVLFGTNTVIDNVEWDAPRPVGTVVLSCLNAPIREGRFLLAVGVSAKDESELYHLLDNWMEFSVFAPRVAEGVVTLEREWHVSDSVGLRAPHVGGG